LIGHPGKQPMAAADPAAEPPPADADAPAEPLELEQPAEPELPPGYDEKETRELFSKCDVDNSGHISHEEFRTTMKELAPGLPPEKLEQGVKELDADGDGEISWEEFDAWWRKMCAEAAATPPSPESDGSKSPLANDANEVANEVEKIMSMGQMVKTAMTVNRMALKLKNKAAEAKNKRVMRQIFVSYAEAFGEKMAEAEMIRDAFEKIDADKSGFIDGTCHPSTSCRQLLSGELPLPIK
jgi:Ca2+-binding EF-hand superfamily protein